MFGIMEGDWTRRGVALVIMVVTDPVAPRVSGENCIPRLLLCMTYPCTMCGSTHRKINAPQNQCTRRCQERSVTSAESPVGQPAHRDRPREGGSQGALGEAHYRASPPLVEDASSSSAS